MTRTARLLTTLAATATLAGGAVSAASAQSADSVVTVSPRSVVATAPANSPIDFAGVRSARRGRPLPADNIVIGRKVSMTRGSEVAYGALTLRCPADHPRLRSLGFTGQVAPQVLFPRNYAGKRSVNVMVTYNARTVPVGGTAQGTVLALCR